MKEKMTAKEFAQFIQNWQAEMQADNDAGLAKMQEQEQQQQEEDNG
jgi:uncharacterized protein YeaO (DUF488 family)